MEKTEQIKKDLRRIRKLSHAIASATTAKERLESHKKILIDSEQNENTRLEISKLERVISSLNLDRLISESTELEVKYITAISSLPPLDQVIILDAYVNGLTYWQIGRKIGYSESGLKKHINKTVENLAKIL